MIQHATTAATSVRETVRMQGHIIDSLMLPKVLDLILREQANFKIVDIEIGKQRKDTSWARIEIETPDRGAMDELLGKLLPHGAVPDQPRDCRLVPADLDGAFPEGFYASTNFPTQLRCAGRWIDVTDLEMDCGIVVDSGLASAHCVPMHQVRRGDLVVVGRDGVSVRPPERHDDDPASFKFMTSAVSSEKPKGVTVRDIAQALRQTRQQGKKILFVGGPAIVHTGAGEHLCRLIRGGFVQVLFAGNALAAHDVEQALFNTSLGVHLRHGAPMEEGHEHHLRAINRIRRLGSLRAAVDQGVLRSGIFYECIRNQIPFVLAGSIRDDGPLPDVITDAVQAADRMRQLRDGVGFCLMVSTMLHSIATGNILPSTVRIACVDINPATVTKLADRGTPQSVGVVTDVEPFLRALVCELFDQPDRAKTAAG